MLTQAELRYWQSEIKSCIERQTRELIRRNNYPLTILYYEGRDVYNPVWPHLSTNEQIAVINEHFPNTNSLISEIMYQNPEIMTTAQKPEAEPGEKVMKGALTYATDKIDSLTENRVGLFDMIYAGYAVIEVDYIKDDLENNRIPSESDIENRKGLLDRVKDRMKPKTTEDAEKKLAKQSPPKEEAYSDYNRTFIRRWNPLNVFPDWKAKRYKDMRYTMKRIELSKSDFDVKYPKFKDKVTVTDESIEYSQHTNQSDRKKVTFYEFQIKRKGNEYWTLVIHPTYGESELDYFRRPYVTNGFNIKFGTFHKYGKIYPVSIAQVNKKLSDELNHYVRFVMEVAERNVPKVGIDKVRVKVDGIEALRSKNVNDVVPVDGPPGNSIHPLQPTVISPENKELIQLFNQQKEKLWSVSGERLNQKAQAKFATELQIQEAGFQSKTLDLQEGLRDLIVQELETLKDIIVNFWDGQHFFKITGGEKPLWYTPQIDPMTGMVLNPLTDILIGDYFIKVDISSALRPNTEKEKQDLILLLRELTSPNVQMVAQAQGRMLNIEFINKIINKFGLNPESIWVQAPQMGVGGGGNTGNTEQ